MGHTPPNPDSLIDDIAEARRRAHQYLQLLEVDPHGAATFLQTVGETSPKPVLAMAACLQQVALLMSPARQKRAVEERLKEAAERRDAQPRGKTGLLAWVCDLGRTTLGVVTEVHPDRRKRIRFLENSARIASEAGGSGLTVS